MTDKPQTIFYVALDQSDYDAVVAMMQAMNGGASSFEVDTTADNVVAISHLVRLGLVEYGMYRNKGRLVKTFRLSQSGLWLARQIKFQDDLIKEKG